MLQKNIAVSVCMLKEGTCLKQAPLLKKLFSLRLTRIAKGSASDAVDRNIELHGCAVVTVFFATVAVPRAAAHPISAPVVSRIAGSASSIHSASAAVIFTGVGSQAVHNRSTCDHSINAVAITKLKFKRYTVVSA